MLTGFGADELRTPQLLPAPFLAGDIRSGCFAVGGEKARHHRTEGLHVMRKTSFASYFTDYFAVNAAVENVFCAERY